jgi:trehalose/maltose hydrolase-like predicted phosphorylase
MAGKMFLPRNDKLGIYAEYEGYTGHPIKQADVAHCFFPIPTQASAEEIRRTANYYLDREQETGLFLTHSPSIYAAAFSKAGDVSGVERCLELSARNFVGPFELPRESNYGGGAVVTGAGSFLNLLCYGVLGIVNFGDRLTANPCVSRQVGKINVSGVQFQGKRYRVSSEQPVITELESCEKYE